MRIAVIALLFVGCATPRQPRRLTLNWPAETTRVGTYLHETRFIDGDGERVTKGTASFAEKIVTRPDGTRTVETFDVLVMNGDPVFRTIARLLEGTVTLDANGNVTKFEREPATAAGPGVKAGNQTLVEKMSPMVNTQLEEDARARWLELLGHWRNRSVDGPSAAWDIGGLHVEVRETFCRLGGPTQCLRLHGITESDTPEGTDALFHAMAHQPATYRSAHERREFVLVTDPATLLPVSFTTTAETTLRGTIAGEDVTFLEAHHSELNWQ
ncbi:MAG: hypothetical protein ACO1OB_09295 [Archangium sp.]